MNSRADVNLAIAMGISEYEIYFTRRQRQHFDIL
jgi:hypothetical protein